MKWIDFDQLEELGNEDDRDQKGKVSVNVPFSDVGLVDSGDIDEEEYLALPKESFSDSSIENDNEEDYFSLPQEEPEPVRERRKYRKKSEDGFLHVGAETEQKDIYAISDEEARHITMEERRSQIGRMLGLRTMQNAQEEKEVQEKVPAEPEEFKLHIPDDYFEEMADRMAEEMTGQTERDAQNFQKEWERENRSEESEEAFGEKQKPKEEAEPEQKPEAEQNQKRETEKNQKPNAQQKSEAEQKPKEEPEPDHKPDPKLERTVEAILEYRLGPDAVKRGLEPEFEEFKPKPESEIQPELEIKSELETEPETNWEEPEQAESKKEYDPMEFGSADEEFEKFRERYRRKLLFKEDDQTEEAYSEQPEENALENGSEGGFGNGIIKEDKINIENQMEEEKQRPQNRDEDIEEDNAEERIEETEENAEDDGDAGESAFVDEEAFRRIELAEKRKQLGVEEQPEEESGERDQKEPSSEEWPEEESGKESEKHNQKEPLGEKQPKEQLEEDFEEESESESGKRNQKELSNEEQSGEKLKEDFEDESEKESGKRNQKEPKKEKEEPRKEEQQKESQQKDFQEESEKRVKKKPALQPETSKAKARPESLHSRKPSNESQNINATVGVLQKRTLPKRQLGLDKEYAQKNLQDTIEQRKNGKVVKTAEQLEKKLQLTEGKGKESSKKIDKLHSTFEEEFQDVAVDDLLVRRDKDARKKAKKRKKHSVAWEEDDTPDHPFREFLTLIAAIAIVVFVTFILVEFVGQRTEVIGSSMEKTLQDGDNLIVDKITYVFDDPERFDIIVFPYVNANGKEVYFIKRIIGLPGEKVRIDNGFIYINDEKLEESYGKDNELILNAGRAVNNILLGEDEYFVLGDNRNDSSDSREIGNIKRDQIVGRAWLRIWPFDKFGIMKHQ